MLKLGYSIMVITSVFGADNLSSILSVPTNTSVAQMVRVPDVRSGCHWFKSNLKYYFMNCQ